MHARSRAWIAAFLAIAGTVPAAGLVLVAPSAIAQESGMPPPDPTRPSEPAAVARTPEDEARRAQAIARELDSRTHKEPSHPWPT